MISNFICELPSYMQLCKWERLFKMNEDGCSFITFYEKLKERENTVLVVKDHNDHVFGCFCRESWRTEFTFYGDGDNFLFTYGTSDKPLFYYWTGELDKFMYATQESIGVGGSLRKGMFALYLHSDFRRGSSYTTEMFDNKTLSS